MTFQSNHLIGFGGGGSRVPFPTISSLQHRYVASLGVTGDPVTQWNDQQGSLNLTNGAGSPDFEPTGGPLGGPAITCDGANEELSATGLSINQPYHFFIVCKQITWAADDRIVAGNSSGFSFIRQKQSSGSQYDVEQGANTPSGNVVDPGDTNWHLISSFFDNSNSYQELDGGSKAGPANIGGGAVNGIAVGGGFGANYGNVSFAEVLLFNAEVTGTDLANLEAYVASNYGITMA